MSKKFIRCVKKVQKSQRLHPHYRKVNPFAVCRKSTGYYGTTHGIGLKHKIVKDRDKMKYFIVKPSGERKYFSYKKDANEYVDKSKYYLPIYTKG